jgi:hypothetical protein
VINKPYSSNSTFSAEFFPILEEARELKKILSAILNNSETS